MTGNSHSPLAELITGTWRKVDVVKRNHYVGELQLQYKTRRDTSMDTRNLYDRWTNDAHAGGAYHATIYVDAASGCVFYSKLPLLVRRPSSEWVFRYSMP